MPKIQQGKKTRIRSQEGTTDNLEWISSGDLYPIGGGKEINPKRRSFHFCFSQRILFGELKHFTYKPLSLKCTSIAFHCADRSTIARVTELPLEIYKHGDRSINLNEANP